MKNLLSAIISVIVFSSAGFAVDNSSDNFTIPHDFSSGETISSQKMNENFNAIQELLNKLIQLNNLTVFPWAGTQQLGSSEYDRGYGVTVDSSDNINVTG